MEKSTVAFFHAMNGRGTKKSLTFRFRSNREIFAEKLHKDIVMSNKPTPAYLAGDGFNCGEVAADLRRTCDAAKANGLAVEMILKDISTVRYQPNRLTAWADCAMRVVESY